MTRTQNARPNQQSKTTAKPTRKPQPRRKRPATTPHPEGNDYLRSLLQPDLIKGARIPDASAIESVTFACTRSFDITVDANGDAAYAFSPNFATGTLPAGGAAVSGLKLGVDTTNQQITMLAAGEPDLPGSNPGCSIVNIMSNTVRDQAEQSFAAIRPVSACLKLVCTQAALTAQGAVAVGLIGRGEIPGRIDGGSLSPGSGMTPWLGQTGIRGIDDIFSSALFAVTNATETTCTNWFPQDSNDFDYRVCTEGARSGAFWTNQYVDALTANTNTIYLPFAAATPHVINSTSVAGGIMPVDMDESSPLIVLAIRGAAGGSITHTATFTINYEAIPLSSEATLFTSEGSPTNPLEEAQALNTARHLPTTRLPDVANDPASAMYRAAIKAADHLATRGATKQVVEGKSFVDELGSAASSVRRWASENSSLLSSAGTALLALL